jgi:hypothetical protein
MQALNVFTIQGVVQPHRPVVAHTRPTDEPLLWVPDIVAGAVNARCGSLSAVFRVPRGSRCCCGASEGGA